MNESNITVVGNALNTPEWRRFERTNALVANFKIASTARRFDKVNNRWIDGDNLRVRVNCWRRLAENVVASVKVGDPLVVTGRLYTRDWTTEDGQRRSAYELEAVAVGHDLARGVGVFKRGRININTVVVEDAESDKRVNGEPTESAPEANARSEALAAGVDGQLRTAANAAQSTGVDGMVNAEPVALENLAEVSHEMKADLAEMIALAEQTLGATTVAPAEPTPAEPTPADGGEDEATTTPEPAEDPPSRTRRTRTRVGASA